MTKYYTIIPAAGSGERLSSVTPKQYLKINNIHILQHSIHPFLDNPLIEKVVVVLNQNDEYWSELSIANHPKMLTTIGGERRMDSVLNGLNLLEKLVDGQDWVLVHDGARPFLKNSELNKLINVIGEHEVGGLLGVPVKDTLKKIDSEGRITSTVDRSSLWHAQTPQMFRFELLKSAIEQAIAKNITLTDEASAIEQAGFNPIMVQGATTNTKITFDEDLLALEENE